MLSNDLKFWFMPCIKDHSHNKLYIYLSPANTFTSTVTNFEIGTNIWMFVHYQLYVKIRLHTAYYVCWEIEHTRSKHPYWKHELYLAVQWLKHTTKRAKSNQLINIQLPHDQKMLSVFAVRGLHKYRTRYCLGLSLWSLSKYAFAALYMKYFSTELG